MWINTRKSVHFLFLGLVLNMWVTPAVTQVVYTVDAAPEADLVVFMTDSEEKSDLKVFFVEEKSQLGKEGVWVGTFNLSEANVKVYFTFEEQEAQLKIFVVDNEAAAGWRNTEKRALMP